MAKIDDIVKAIDNKLLETGKEHLILQQASKLLLSLGIIESTKELKQILERGEIPHACSLFLRRGEVEKLHQIIRRSPRAPKKQRKQTRLFKKVNLQKDFQ